MATETEIVTQNIRIDKILIDDEFNCREDITKASIFELAADIEKNGLQQGVSVRPLTDSEKLANPGKEFGLIMGFRRTKASVSLGWETIPARIQLVSREKAAMLNLVENLHRVDLTFWEEALIIKRFFDKGYSRKMISDEISKPMGWVQRRMQVWQLPVKGQELVKAGILTSTSVSQLNGYSDPEELDQILDKARERYQNSGADGKRLIKIPTATVTKRDRGEKKKARTKGEILNAMRFLREDLRIPHGIWYRAMSWAAGEISDQDFLYDLKAFMKEIYEEDLEIPTTGIPDMGMF